MKKNFLRIFSFLILASSSYSAPVGNPASPRYIEKGFFLSPGSIIDFRIGYEKDYVSNCRLRQKISSHRRINDYSINANMATFTFNIHNRCDLFGLFGEGQLQANWQVEYPVNTITKYDAESHYHFIWMTGAKAIFFEWGNFSLTFGGRYERVHPKVAWITQDGSAIDCTNAKMKYTTWQIETGMSYKIDLFIPYIGGKYSRKQSYIHELINVSLADNGSNTLYMKERKKFGFFLGCGITTGNLFALNIETRLIDEEGVTVTGEFRF